MTNKTYHPYQQHFTFKLTHHSIKTITKEKEVPMIREVEVEKNLSLWDKIKIKFGGLSIALNLIMTIISILAFRRKK